MRKRENLILGMGNPILSDDAVGLMVLKALKISLSEIEHHEINFKENYTGGMDLLEDLSGFKRLMIIDSFISDTYEPGECLQFYINSEKIKNQCNLISSHGLNLPILWELGTRLEFDMPEECMIIGIVAYDCINFSEKLSDKLSDSFNKIVNTITQEAINWFSLNTCRGGN